MNDLAAIYHGMSIAQAIPTHVPESQLMTVAEVCVGCVCWVYVGCVCRTHVFDTMLCTHILDTMPCTHA